MGWDKTIILIYESSGLSIGSFAQVLDQAKTFLNNGNDQMKIRLGYQTIEEEINLISCLNDELGNNIELMVDYNQGLIVDQAFERCKNFDEL